MRFLHHFIRAILKIKGISVVLGALVHYHASLEKTGYPIAEFHGLYGDWEEGIYRVATKKNRHCKRICEKTVFKNSVGHHY